LSWVDRDRADYLNTGRGAKANPLPPEKFELADKLKFSVNGTRLPIGTVFFLIAMDRNDLPLANSGTSRLNI
jgi:hypothetical protein